MIIVVMNVIRGQRLSRAMKTMVKKRSLAPIARLDSLSDPCAWGDLDENDPRSMAKMMRKMGQEMGEELPEEFDEVVDRLEAGESPESIEETMPDLGLGDDM
jgi:hypothetical protein